MKISQLLAPVNEAFNDTVNPNSPLGKAQAAAAAKANSMNPKVGGVPNLNTGLPQATTNPQPTTLGAPTAVKNQQAAQEPAKPGNNAFGNIARSLGNTAQPAAGGTTTRIATGVQHTAAAANPNQPVPAQTATTPAAKPGINWGGVGNVLKTGIKGAADLGSQAVGGVAQAALSGVGGAVRGYKTARGGGKFGSAGWDTGPAASSANAAGDQELAQLKSQIQSMNQRLQKAGIAERKS